MCDPAGNLQGGRRVLWGAKPDRETLARAPHELIDIRDPEESYSAGDFVDDASREIDAAYDAGRIPLLVGGTMLYFRSLIEGIAELPAADPAVRQSIDKQAAEHGWQRLHERLAEIDPVAAARINRNDSQRIQRALEVFEVSGRTLTQWHEDASPGETGYRFIKFALVPADRALLHARIGERLQRMLSAGFVDEVRGLRQRPALTEQHGSMRSVGYRQFWHHLDGETDLETATYKTLVATRQLAKRQMTWLRSEKELYALDPLAANAFDAISAAVAKRMDERDFIGENAEKTG